MTAEKLAEALALVRQTNSEMSLRALEVLLHIPPKGSAKVTCVSDVAELSGLQKSGVSRAVVQLIDYNYADKTRREVDQRTVALVRTRQGDQLVSRIEDALSGVADL